MKSVHITNYYHRDSGGISTAYNKLLEAANRHSRHVRLIVPGETSRTEPVGDFGLIYYVKANYSPLFDKRYRVMLPWKTYIFDKAPIKTILRREKPDMIEVGEKYSLSLMAGLMRKGVMNVTEKRPMLVHLSCERMDDNVRSFVSENELPRRFARWYMANYIAPMFDFHLANSQYTADEILRSVEKERRPVSNGIWRMLRAAKVPLRKRVFVNHCGVDLKTFSAERKTEAKRQAVMAEMSLPPGSKMLLYAGRLSPEKNVRLLVGMMGRLAEKDLYLAVAGAGPLSETIARELERAAPGRVRMLGNVDDRERLADLFAISDLFIHPNPREPFGIAPLEAMASGLAVVAPNSGGLLSYADDSNAYLVEPTAEAFAEAVERSLSDESGRKAKIAAAMATAKGYSWESSTDALFALYDAMFAEFAAHRDLYDYRNAAREVNFADEASTAA